MRASMPSAQSVGVTAVRSDRHSSADVTSAVSPVRDAASASSGTTTGSRPALDSRYSWRGGRSESWRRAAPAQLPLTSGLLMYEDDPHSIDQFISPMPADARPHQAAGGKDVRGPLPAGPRNRHPIAQYQPLTGTRGDC